VKKKATQPSLVERDFMGKGRKGGNIQKSGLWVWESGRGIIVSKKGGRRWGNPSRQNHGERSVLYVGQTKKHHSGGMFTKRKIHTVTGSTTQAAQGRGQRGAMKEIEKSAE